MRPLCWLLLSGLIAVGERRAADAANILAITPIAAASHWNVMSSVLDVLVNRGHKITVVSPFPRKTPHENYTTIDVSKLVPFAIASPWDTVINVYKPSTMCIKFLNTCQQHMCHTAFGHPDLQNALRTRAYDLVITELLASRCDSYLASQLGIPHVAFVSSQMLTWYQDSFDNPSNPAYITTLNSPYPKPETFVQRFWNVIDYVRVYSYFKYVDVMATAIGRQYFGKNQPDVETIIRNISVVFLNTHSSFDLHKPLAANFKEIGGIHLKPAKPLPADLQEFIESAEHGVIYFNLGSVVRMEDMPIDLQNGIKEGFAGLPQKILWKLESNSTLYNQPKNVYTRKWYPQYDVIRHPNVKLFITHGGNSGVIEAISAGIPVLGIPIFFDQPRNLELFEHWGSGLWEDYSNFTKESFVGKIKKILGDPRFKENAVKLSNRFHDRPISPQETVAYWTEYVLRHNGAHHLKSQAINTNWFEYFSLDFLVLVSVLTTSLLYFLYNIMSIVKFW
ncbi:UDP-glucuronosyl/UDP-glucosyltransferase [Cinara cedri]|uniref:UDP-glucuronosyltransferase n=1 Tax=Cinara cedri TaxID=506608 RepID=A0A5E4M2Y7_9HEMI|nr:UDP-glucuronosyl/UDP-glucosyltransferase [Cinara cedri]